jgi:hypothetical protein
VPFLKDNVLILVVIIRNSLENGTLNYKNEELGRLTKKAPI